MKSLVIQWLTVSPKVVSICLPVVWPMNWDLKAFESIVSSTIIVLFYNLLTLNSLLKSGSNQNSCLQDFWNEWRRDRKDVVRSESKVSFEKTGRARRRGQSHRISGIRWLFICDGSQSETRRRVLRFASIHFRKLKFNKLLIQIKLWKIKLWIITKKFNYFLQNKVL